MKTFRPSIACFMCVPRQNAPETFPTLLVVPYLNWIGVTALFPKYRESIPVCHFWLPKEHTSSRQIRMN
ncbi:hypothetical protein EG68_00183 [Paragonimus skrjabini miyazakii]|uniref:Uncharacterized protein n=1 Tax=Paragonimus skrjabini miyazakii TaxID=59628 RepID=A0A8S9ZA66_9TREM|nr:hypothetical protein EG68_00183 [Paragonimus skrjabini miyazakii]